MNVEKASRKLYCTLCKRPTPHSFIEIVEGLAKYGCGVCARVKLLTAGEARA